MSDHPRPVVPGQHGKGRLDRLAGHVRARNAFPIAGLTIRQLDPDHEVLALGPAMRGVLDLLFQRHPHAKELDALDSGGRANRTGDILHLERPGSQSQTLHPGTYEGRERHTLAIILPRRRDLGLPVSALRQRRFILGLRLTRVPAISRGGTWSGGSPLPGSPCPRRSTTR